MSNLMTASRQWMNRPADERFWSVPDLLDHLKTIRQKEIPLEVGSLDVQPSGPKGQDLELIGPNGNPVAMTNWGFSQLCQRVDAPASYLSKLPANLACENIRHGIQAKREERAKALLQVTATDSKGKPNAVQLRALTGGQATCYH